MTPEATRLAAALYAHVAETVVPVSTPRVAEMAKLMENTFRHVNIGAGQRDGDAVRQAGDRYLGGDRRGGDQAVRLHAVLSRPRAWAGTASRSTRTTLPGRCRKTRAGARFIELAGDINDRMPDYVVEKVADALNDRGKSLRGSRILVLGVAYKSNVSDVRESPALKVIHRLHRKGAEVEYHDPHVPMFLNGSGPMYSMPLSEESNSSKQTA